MKVLANDGQILGGAAGVVELAKHYGWAAAFVALARVPWGLRAMESVYRLIANCRPCANGACKVRPLFATHSRSRPRRHITTTFFEMP